METGKRHSVTTCVADHMSGNEVVLYLISLRGVSCVGIGYLEVELGTRSCPPGPSRRHLVAGMWIVT